MKSGKGPGPDGYTVEFFTQNWDCIKQDFVSAVECCFSQDYMYHTLNSTIITLVPKVQTPNSMKEFHPISCWNVMYKCYSKILTERLKTAAWTHQ